MKKYYFAYNIRIFAKYPNKSDFKYDFQQQVLISAAFNFRYS